MTLDEMIANKMKDKAFRAAYLSEAGRLLLAGDPCGARVVLDSFTAMPGTHEAPLTGDATMQSCVELLVRLQEAEGIELAVNGAPRLVADKAA